jgi:transcriptional regulator with XRE-family HTH domain
LILTEYQGLTQKELGERLGLSFSGAKSRVQRAREKLKQELLAVAILNWIAEGTSWTINRAVTVVNSPPVLKKEAREPASRCVLFCRIPSLQVKGNERGAALFSWRVNGKEDTNEQRSPK